MTSPSLRRSIRQFRLGRSTVIAAVLALVVGLLGYPWAALGVWIGVALFVGNLLLLHEIARSLVAAQGRRGWRSAAVGSSLGRFLLLGLLLALVGIFLGREALLGACGGLLIAQVNLTFPAGRSTEAV
jgi:hypothetical protein